MQGISLDIILVFENLDIFKIIIIITNGGEWK